MNILGLLTSVKILITPLFLMFSLSAFAQSASERAATKVEIKPLEVGDTIPKELWEMPMQVVNHPSGKPSIKLSDYRDQKLIILDFWATYCSSCIANMPRTHKFQSEIDGVIFLPVSFETLEKVSPFIKKNYITDSLNLYSVVGDTVFSKYFPYKSIPHFVWITADGKVRSITQAQQVTEKNIREMLASPGKTKLALAQKIDKSSALLLSDEILAKGIRQYSIFIKGARPELVTAFFERSKEGVIYGRCQTNTPLKSMYGSIVNGLLRHKGIIFNMTTDIILDVKEPAKLDFKLRGIDSRDFNRQELKFEWDEENLYSYDVILPVESSVKLYESILSLINNSTPYEGIIEKRKINGKEKYMLIISDDEQ